MLTTFGPLATKTIGIRGGRQLVLSGYGDAAHFSCQALPFQGLDGLHRCLRRLAGMSCSFVIRGRLLPTAGARRCRRLLRAKREDGGSVSPATFEAAARRWLALDIDGFDAGDDWHVDLSATMARIGEALPDGFGDTSAVCQITSSALIKPGARLRLWYVLGRSVTDLEARRWLASTPVDRSLFRAVQPHYTAAPRFDGCTDPIGQRLVPIRRRHDVLAVPPIPQPEPARPVACLKPATSAAGYAEAALRYECDGIIGMAPGGRHEALNRAAFKLARFIASGELVAGDVVNGLIWAARSAGIDDGDDELRRFLRYGLRAGYERAGRS